MYPSNFDRTMPLVEPSYQSFVVKPPERNITYGRMPVRIIIRSEDRNTDKYPDPANYTVLLNNEITEVVAIELAQACIPNSGYNVNEHNNKIYFQESYDRIFVATIPVGNYTDITTLAAAVQVAMVSTVGITSAYTAFVNTPSQIISITSDLSGGDHIFRLLFRRCQCRKICEDCSCCIPCQTPEPPEYALNSAGLLLGFDKQNYGQAIGTVLSFDVELFTLIGNCTLFTQDFVPGMFITFDDDVNKNIFTVVSVISNTEATLSPVGVPLFADTIVGSKINIGEVKAPMLSDLNGCKELSLYIDAGNESNVKNKSNNKNIDGSFAVIFLTSAFGFPTIVNTGTTARVSETKFFNPPLRKVQQFTIQFKTPDGHFYDFHGRNHTIDLEIQSLNAPGIYNSIRSNN